MSATHSMQRSRTNATILGVASMGRTLLVAAAVLIGLFVFVKPEATQGFGFFERLAFWSLHIGLGLASLVVASRLIGPSRRIVRSTLAAVIVTGLVGCAILAPVYFGIEQLMPDRLAEPPDDWLDVLATKGLLPALLAEFIEVLPVYFVAWLAINLPLVFSRTSVLSEPPDDPDGSGGKSNEDSEEVVSAEQASDTFLARLPKAIGDDLVVVSSDMHYLHVHTTRGQCMLLGTLKEVAEELGEAGMRVHRSHWVARDHVEKLVRDGQSWFCQLSTGSRVPVSRRQRKQVSTWFGHGARVVPMKSRKTG